MSVTIYHNPDCGTSRNTLAMIRQSGEEPVVIEYLKHPPSRARLIELIEADIIVVLKSQAGTEAPAGGADFQIVIAKSRSRAAPSLSGFSAGE